MSKEVCVYSYKQKTVVAPSQMTEVTWERRNKSLTATKCNKETIKDGKGKRNVKICNQETEDFFYIIPAFVENLVDFLELNVPEPHEYCQTYRYEIPEVICMVCFIVMRILQFYKIFTQDVTDEECSEITIVDSETVTKYLDTIWLDYNFYKGSCGTQILTQQIQVC